MLSGCNDCWKTENMLSGQLIHQIPADLFQAHGSKKGRRKLLIDDLQNNVSSLNIMMMIKSRTYRLRM